MTMFSPPSLPATFNQLHFTLLLFLSLLSVSTSECDLAGLCLRLHAITKQNNILCNADDECLHTPPHDCFNDPSLPNQFYCDPTDCVVIHTLAPGENNGNCNEHFPNIRNTAMEEFAPHDLSDEFPADSFAQSKPSKDKPILKDGVLQFHSALRKEK